MCEEAYLSTCVRTCVAYQMYDLNCVGVRMWGQGCTTYSGSEHHCRSDWWEILRTYVTEWIHGLTGGVRNYVYDVLHDWMLTGTTAQCLT